MGFREGDVLIDDNVDLSAGTDLQRRLHVHVALDRPLRHPTEGFR